MTVLRWGAWIKKLVVAVDLRDIVAAVGLALLTAGLAMVSVVNRGAVRRNTQ